MRGRRAWVKVGRSGRARSLIAPKAREDEVVGAAASVIKARRTGRASSVRLDPKPRLVKKKMVTVVIR
jgi:hypothetical protein